MIKPRSLIAALLCLSVGQVFGDTTPQTLPFNQDWSNAGLISVNDNWNGVPGVVGFLGDYDTGSPTNVDPRTLTADFATNSVDVIANQSNPNTLATGGVAEFDGIANPSIALNGSGTADAPHIVLYINTTGATNVSVSLNVRDLDASADDATQQVNVQFRVGSTGAWTSVPGGYIADATDPNSATRVTPLSLVLPSSADNQPLVQVRIMTTNAGGNDEWIAIDDIAVGGPPGQITLSPATLPGGFVGLPFSQMITAVNNGGQSCAFSSTGTLPSGLTLSSGSSNTATLAGTPTTADSYSFTITANCGTAGSGQRAYTVVISPRETPGFCTSPTTLTLIHDIQGSDETSPLDDQVRTVEGVVTRLLTGTVNDNAGRIGFFVQEETSDMDALPGTSEGIFVDYTGVQFEPVVGNRVRLTGTVNERFGQTRIENVTAFATCGTGTVTAAPLSFPIAAGTTLERYEGMRVSISQLLTVTGNENLGSFGELRLATGRLYAPTQLELPDSAAYNALLDLNQRSTIILDDGSQLSNDNLPGYLYPEPNGLRWDNTVRAGDVLTSGIQGVLEFAFSNYRIHPVAPVTFGPDDNARPTLPERVGGRLRVASWNVLNYFTTFGSRGASNASEFQRQKDKIVAAVQRLNPDVLGVTELQNNGATALNDLLLALNASTPGKYAGIVTGGSTDQIQNAIIYQAARVAPVGTPLEKIPSPFGNRPSVAQIFRPANARAPSLEQFAFVINHLRSKGSSCGPGNDSPSQGNCNGNRLQAAQELVTWLNTTVVPLLGSNPKILFGGDFNAYRLEDPVRHITQIGGYTNLAEALNGPRAYSYIFTGLSGTLDYLFASPSAERLITDATEWHTNADEPEALDYNIDGKIDDPAIDLYNPDPFRSSDHDPILAGFNPLCGDLDDDGEVDAVDLALIALRLGQPVARVDRRMDFDRRDAIITLNDIRGWTGCFVAYQRATRGN